jgi:hypothetical protein
MSDLAKTPGEIEDVLASVRRLVSDHAPTRDDAREPSVASSDAPAAEPEQPNALVLTPSFRVTDPEDPWVPVPESAELPENSDLPETHADADAGSEAEDLVSELLSAEGDGGTEAADGPEAAEPARNRHDETDWLPDDRLASFDAVGAGDAEAVEDDRPLPEPWVDGQGETGAEAMLPEGDAPDAPHRDAAEAAEVDFEPESDPADFESETGDDDWPESSAEAALLTLVARREPSGEAAEPTADPSEGEAEPEESDDRPETGPTLESEAAEDAAAPEHGAEEAEAMADAPREAAFAPVEDQHPTEAAPHLREVGSRDPEEHSGGQGAAAPDESAPSDPPHPEPFQPQEAAADPVEDLGETPSPFSFPEADEGILDEDTLREIIVEVVREELQGVLGQRITRNVRKMVRREIRLALAAEDLE